MGLPDKQVQTSGESASSGSEIASESLPNRHNVLLRQTSMGSKWQGAVLKSIFGGCGKEQTDLFQHCYVTGGSTGLGLALSILLAQQGADVSIVARNEGNLKAAIDKLEVSSFLFCTGRHKSLTAHLQAVRQSEDQKFAWYPHSLTSAKESQEALQAVIAGHNGETPDGVFLCAGGSKPKFFVEMSEEELVQGMDMGYWVQAWTAWVCASFSGEGRTNLMIQGREQRDD